MVLEELLRAAPGIDDLTWFQGGKSRKHRLQKYPDSYAPDIHAGRRRPHPMHWLKLTELIGMSPRVEQPIRNPLSLICRV